MADDDDGDVYDEEFDFVDDELDDEELDAEPEAADPEVDDPAPVRAEYKERDGADREREDLESSERNYEDGPEDVVEEDPYATPPAAANYLVHIYEYRQFKRTIDRPFTGEDAEAFASEYNRTAKPYGRFAVAGKDDAKPHKNLDDR